MVKITFIMCESESVALVVWSCICLFDVLKVIHPSFVQNLLKHISVNQSAAD